MKKVGYVVLLKNMWKKCKSFLGDRMEMVGKAPLCNLKPDRAPHINGKAFILCWRCSMVIISFMFVHVLYFYRIVDFKLEWWQIGLLLCPLVIDGLVQKYTAYESNNLKRIVTGGMFGVGVYCIFFVH